MSKASANLGFSHIAIDANPPSAAGCCLDVLALGDIDGDGKIDAALGSEHGGGWYWYRNPAKGDPNTPGWPRYKIGDGDFTTDGRLVDVNGDQRLDFVVSSINRDEIEWWENGGNPAQASSWTRHTIGDRFAHDLVVGDLSGDGKVDVVMFRKDNPAELVWFEQPADAKKTWTRHALAENLGGEGLTIGNVDGDKDLDIVASHYLFKNTDGKGGRWERTELPSICTSGSKEDIRPAIADINRDGKPDILLGPAEDCIGPVAWFAGPAWKRHEIMVGDSGELRGNHTELRGNHTLEVADFDGDGQLDLLLGEMHTGAKRVMVYQNLSKGSSWKRILLSSEGTHNARIADLNADGRPDIVGKNYDGPKKVEAWLSRVPTTLAPGSITPVVNKLALLPLDKWTYKRVDDSRERLNGDFAFVGLAFGDINRDGFSDIASGKYFYRNPGGNLMGEWARITFPVNADAIAVSDVDGDAQPDVLALRLPKLYWLKPGSNGESWSVKEVASGFEPTEHTNPQGYGLAQIRPGGKPELVFGTGQGLWYVEIPANPSNPWPKVQITAKATSEDLLAVGDIDRDGDGDAVGSLMPKGNQLVWFENPGNGQDNWNQHPLGSTELWADRSGLEDLNGDDRPDLIVSEENGEEAGAATYWFENPAKPTTAWTRHTIAIQGSTNSLSVADMDGDGDSDVITGEHRGEKRVIIWENRDKAASWVAHQVDRGKESHLGARAIDLDKDGDLDLLSIAWDRAEEIHLWRNDAR
jgi:hypothetical protein